jgi:hypothetical protein
VVERLSLDLLKVQNFSFSARPVPVKPISVKPCSMNLPQETFSGTVTLPSRPVTLSWTRNLME